MNCAQRRQRKAAPPSEDIFVRPGRRTPRLPKWKLEELKEIERFNFTEDGVPIRRSEDDLLDEAYAEGVKAGLDAAQGRAFHRIGEMFYALAKAPDRLRRRIENLIYRELFEHSDDG